MRQCVLALSLCIVASSMFAADSRGGRRGESVVRVAPSALQAAFDPATGRFRELSPEEARELATRFLASLKIRPAVARTLSTGATVIDLDDSYLNFYLARLTPEGTLQFDCVNTPSDAVALLVAPAPSIMRRAAGTDRGPQQWEEK